MNWLITKGLQFVGSKLDGYKTKIGGVGLILIGIVNMVNLNNIRLYLETQEGLCQDMIVQYSPSTVIVVNQKVVKVVGGVIIHENLG